LIEPADRAAGRKVCTLANSRPARDDMQSSSADSSRVAGGVLYQCFGTIEVKAAVRVLSATALSCAVCPAPYTSDNRAVSRVIVLSLQ
jgi:hypothetical protein